MHPCLVDCPQKRLCPGAAGPQAASKARRQAWGTEPTSWVRHSWRLLTEARVHCRKCRVGLRRRLTPIPEPAAPHKGLCLA